MNVDRRPRGCGHEPADRWASIGSHRGSTPAASVDTYPVAFGAMNGASSIDAYGHAASGAIGSRSAVTS
jgi:hypothetical protein